MSNVEELRCLGDLAENLRSYAHNIGVNADGITAIRDRLESALVTEHARRQTEEEKRHGAEMLVDALQEELHECRQHSAGLRAERDTERARREQADALLARYHAALSLSVSGRQSRCYTNPERCNCTFAQLGRDYAAYLEHTP